MNTAAPTRRPTAQDPQAHAPQYAAHAFEWPDTLNILARNIDRMMSLCEIMDHCINLDPPDIAIARDALNVCRYIGQDCQSVYHQVTPTSAHATR